MSGVGYSTCPVNLRLGAQLSAAVITGRGTPPRLPHWHRVPHPFLSVQATSGLMLLLTGALGVQHHPAPPDKGAGASGPRMGLMALAQGSMLSWMKESQSGWRRTPWCLCMKPFDHAELGLMGGGLCSVEMAALGMSCDASPQLACCSLPASGVGDLRDSCLLPTVSPLVEQNKEAFIQPGLPQAVHAFSIFP